MSILVNIHKSHRIFTEGQTVAAVEGRTVGDCLNDLVRQFPDIRRVLYTQSGELVRNIDIYVNQKSAYPDEVRQPVSDGDEIHLNLLLMGG